MYLGENFLDKYTDLYSAMHNKNRKSELTWAYSSNEQEWTGHGKIVCQGVTKKNCSWLEFGLWMRYLERSSLAVKKYIDS